MHEELVLLYFTQPLLTTDKNILWTRFDKSVIPLYPYPMQWLSIRRQHGTPRIAGFYTITGESLVAQVRWPGGALVWNTPIAIHVQRRGHTTRQHVVDVTRLAQIVLALFTVVIIAQLGRKQKEGSHE